MFIRPPRPFRALLGVPLLLMAACSDLLRDDLPPAEDVLVRVADEDLGKTLRVGYPVRLFAFVSDRGGLGVGDAEVRWTVSEGGGTIQAASGRTNGNGFVEAVWTPGTAAGLQSLRVEVVGGAGSDTIPDIRFYPDTVVGAVVAAAEADTVVEGDFTTVSLGGAFDRHGNAYRLVPGENDSPPAVTFTSLDPDVATLSGQAPYARTLTAVAPGTARVVAAAGGRADTVEVVVRKFVPKGSFRSLSGGLNYFTCAAGLADGAYCWGDNSMGQLGTGGGAALSTVPVAVAGLSGVEVVGVGAGFSHACAVTAAGDVWCWGDNATGQVGDGSFDARPTAVKAGRPAGVTYASVGAGFGFTCALATGGDAWCWGDNTLAQLGSGDASGAPSADPVRVDAPAGVTFASLFVGAGHACGLTSAGAAWCWGYNDFGQIGDGSAGVNAISPVRVQGPGGAMRTLGLGLYHTCAALADGKVYCWGDNAAGQLGNGTTDASPTPVAVSGPLAAVALSNGFTHTCALDAAGLTFCWGDNTAGRLGTGNETASPVPVAVQSGPLRFASIALGNEHGCAVGTDGEAYCWGTNFFGELGNGEAPGTGALTPTRVVPPAAPAASRGAAPRAAAPRRTPRPAWCGRFPTRVTGRSGVCR